MVSQRVWYSSLNKGGDPGAVVEALAWKSGDHGFEPHAGLQVSKKQIFSSPLTRKYSILSEASVAER